MEVAHSRLLSAQKAFVIAAAGALALSIGSPALADPCKAIPDKGPMPNWIYRGAQISAGVNYVGDGDSFCLITGEDPRTWVEIRLSNFNAPELSEPGGAQSKTALARLILHKPLQSGGAHLVTQVTAVEHAARRQGRQAP